MSDLKFADVSQREAVRILIAKADQQHRSRERWATYWRRVTAVLRAVRRKKA